MTRSKPPAPRGAAAKPQPRQQASRRGVLMAVGVGALAVAATGTLVFQRGRSGGAAPASRPELASDHSPSVGDATAKVHVVEFLDPACETCAQFYPLVKQMMAAHPNRIRLSLRHVPLHPGADYPVAMLEASRKQGKYWQTLETLLATQNLWVPRHVVIADKVREAVANVGLDMARLEADMKAADVSDRMARDRRDATALDVRQTPEYFVNGRQMESFGRQQLQRLIDDAVRAAY